MDSECERQSKRPKTNKHQNHIDQQAHDQQEQEQVLSTGLEALPREIIFDILSKLPISSLVRSTSVCRAWRLLLSRDRSLAAELALSASRSPDRNPCLIFHCDFPIRNQLYFADFDADAGAGAGGDRKPYASAVVGKIRSPFCSSMPEYDVVGSCNGLLCLSDSLYNESLVIYNPFTRDFRELPRSSIKYPSQEGVVFGFGFSPETGEYKAVKITYYRNIRQRRLVRNNNNNNNHNNRVFVSRSPRQSECQVLTLGQNAGWRSVGRVSHSLHHGPPGQVLVRGRLHWVSGPRRYQAGRSIVSFDIAGERFEEVPRPNPDTSGLRKAEYNLFALRGRLAAAFGFGNGKVEIWVMKEYGVRESWEREFVIGNYTPKGIKEDVLGNQVLNASKVRRKCVKVLCVLKSGEVLLEYKGKSRALVVYDPKCGKFKDVMVKGMPNYWCQTVLHLGTLNRIDSLIGM